MDAALVILVGRTGEIDVHDVPMDEGPTFVARLAMMLDETKLVAEGWLDGAFLTVPHGNFHRADILPAPGANRIEIGTWLEPPSSEGDRLITSAGTWTGVRLNTSDVLAQLTAGVGRPQTNDEQMIEEVRVLFEREHAKWKDGGGVGKRPSVSGIAKSVAAKNAPEHAVTAVADRIRKKLKEQRPDLVRTRHVE